MMFFKRNKIKLSLIDDYIKILLIENFYKNNFSVICLDENLQENFNSAKDFNFQLKIEYDKLFERLKLNDLSLLILKKELKFNNYIFNKLQQDNFSSLQSTLNTIKLLLNSISNNLKEKIKALNLN